MTEDTLPVGVQSDQDSMIAFRGGSAIPEEELRAHLASLLRLENVGVLLGSGSS